MRVPGQAAVGGVLFEGEGWYSARELIIVEAQVVESSQCPKFRWYSAREMITDEAQVAESSQCPKLCWYSAREMITVEVQEV
jgi:hypothetical protein